MLAQMTSVQFSEWIAWLGIEHLGDHPEARADLRMAIETAVLANHTGRKKPLKPQDVMPKFEREQQTPEDLHARMMALANRQQK